MLEEGNGANNSARESAESTSPDNHSPSLSRRSMTGMRSWIGEMALLAAVGTGVYGSVPEACAAVIKIAATLRPQRRTAQVYDRLYPRYRSLYQALRPEFQGIAAS